MEADLEFELAMQQFKTQPNDSKFWESDAGQDCLWVLTDRGFDWRNA